MSSGILMLNPPRSVLGKPAAKNAGGDPGDAEEGLLFKPRAAERPFGELNGSNVGVLRRPVYSTHFLKRKLCWLTSLNLEGRWPEERKPEPESLRVLLLAGKRNGGHSRVCSVIAALGKFRQSMNELYSPASANVSMRTSLLYLLGGA